MKARNIAFYKFAPILEPQVLRETIKCLAQNAKLKGTVLIANEGINGMLSGEEFQVCAFEEALKSKPQFEDLTFRLSYSDFIPFKKLLVKVKPEILTLGISEIQPQVERGNYISPTDLCAALDQGEDLILVDVRNSFEVDHGTFLDAVDPRTKSFSEFKGFADKLNLDKSKKIITFCTGGIRCEKGTLLLKKAGFKSVFQLEGGILEYFSQVKGGKHFKGNCFVFDQRELVDPELNPVSIKV